MVWLIRKCEKCGKYTLKKEVCSYCGGKIRISHPPKFSPDDKYLKYRMALKKEVLNSERNYNSRTQKRQFE